MGNVIKRIDGEGQSIKPQSTRPRVDYSSDRVTAQHQFHQLQANLSPHRLIFEPFIYLPLVLERTKNLKPDLKLQAYGNIFKMLFYFLELEEERRLSGLPFSQDKMKAYLLGLELTRRHFRAEFPDEEFPL